MKHISSKSPTATVYKCEQGGLHLVIREVNIALDESEFFSTNEQIQEANMMIRNGTWPCEYVQLTFCKVTLVVHTDDLRIVASVMEKAKVVIENRKKEEMIVDMRKENKNKMLPVIDGKKFQPFLN